jgi:hypothetical protein
VGQSRRNLSARNAETPIYSSTVGEGPKVHVIRVGTARQRDQLFPKVQLWCRSSQRWLSGLVPLRRSKSSQRLIRLDAVDDPGSVVAPMVGTPCVSYAMLAGVLDLEATPAISKRRIYLNAKCRRTLERPPPSRNCRDQMCPKTNTLRCAFFSRVISILRVFRMPRAELISPRHFQKAYIFECEVRTDSSISHPPLQYLDVPYPLNEYY